MRLAEADERCDRDETSDRRDRVPARRDDRPPVADNFSPSSRSRQFAPESRCSLV